jgi:hypothetical protein
VVHVNPNAWIEGVCGRAFEFVAEIVGAAVGGFDLVDVVTLYGLVDDGACIVHRLRVVVATFKVDPRAELAAESVLRGDLSAVIAFVGRVLSF